MSFANLSAKFSSPFATLKNPKIINFAYVAAAVVACTGPAGLMPAGGLICWSSLRASARYKKQNITDIRASLAFMGLFLGEAMVVLPPLLLSSSSPTPLNQQFELSSQQTATKVAQEKIVGKITEGSENKFEPLSEAGTSDYKRMPFWFGWLPHKETVTVQASVSEKPIIRPDGVFFTIHFANNGKAVYSQDLQYVIRPPAPEQYRGRNLVQLVK